MGDLGTPLSDTGAVFWRQFAMGGPGVGAGDGLATSEQGVDHE
jgi:hypothetical protein